MEQEIFSELSSHIDKWEEANISCPCYNKTHGEVREIIQSMKSFYNKRDMLTYGQESYLNALFSDYSNENYEQCLNWAYTEEKKAAAKTIAEYYSSIDGGAYFTAARHKIREDMPLSYKEWHRMCDNKYSRRILEEVSRDPRFKKGQQVQIRVNRLSNLVKLNNVYFKREMIENYAIVIDDNAKIPISNAKGCRTYKILPIGYPKAIYAEERDIKRAKKLK